MSGRYRVGWCPFVRNGWKHILDIARSWSLYFKTAQALSFRSSTVHPMDVGCSNVCAISPICPPTVASVVKAAMVGLKSIHGGERLLIPKLPSQDASSSVRTKSSRRVTCGRICCHYDRTKRHEHNSRSGNGIILGLEVDGPEHPG